MKFDLKKEARDSKKNKEKFRLGLTTAIDTNKLIDTLQKTAIHNREVQDRIDETADQLFFSLSSSTSQHARTSQNRQKYVSRKYDLEESEAEIKYLATKRDWQLNHPRDLTCFGTNFSNSPERRSYSSRSRSRSLSSSRSRSRSLSPLQKFRPTMKHFSSRTPQQDKFKLDPSVHLENRLKMLAKLNFPSNQNDVLSDHPTETLHSSDLDYDTLFGFLK